MAKFCEDCYPLIWGELGNDFTGLISAQEVAHGFLAACLCEGCGGIVLVDNDGHVRGRDKYKAASSTILRDQNSDDQKSDNFSSSRLHPRLLTE